MTQQTANPRFLANVLVERHVRQFCYIMVEGSTRAELREIAAEAVTDDDWNQDEGETNGASVTTMITGLRDYETGLEYTGPETGGEDIHEDPLFEQYIKDKAA
jgi:hypothetical protein